MDVVAIVVGLGLVLWMLADSFETLLATNLRTSRWSFTRSYYRGTWWCGRRLCLRIRDEARREGWLSRFGPLSFLGLLATWTVIEIAGWGLVWWGFRDSFGSPLRGIADAFYYSGVVYFSIGFGDILPATGGMRFLTVVEGFSGLGTLGLVIGFLPTLTSAYSARERQLLKLDDLTDARITPVSLVRSYLGPDGDLTALNAMFDEWADWCAEVYDSHTSLPVLLWFRSKHRGHSWITGLGVVTDAAIAFVATVPGQDHGPAMRLQRQSVRLVAGLAQRVGLEPKPDPPMSARFWSVGYTVMSSTNLPMRGFDESFGRLRALRSEFHPYMEAFIDELLAPRGFWGVTAADHLAEADFSALFEPDDDT
ncbi:hypothetical protein BH10ACT1_BH10ACT1_02280 [soil metagenome]